MGKIRLHRKIRLNLSQKMAEERENFDKYFARVAEFVAELQRTGFVVTHIDNTPLENFDRDNYSHYQGSRIMIQFMFKNVKQHIMVN